MADTARTDRVFKALADGNRRRILRVVAEDPHAVGEIASRTGLSQQTTSHHVKVLRDAGLLTETRSGTRHLFAVRTDGLRAARGLLDDFWPDRLRALKAAVEGDGGGA